MQRSVLPLVTLRGIRSGPSGVRSPGQLLTGQRVHDGLSRRLRRSGSMRRRALPAGPSHLHRPRCPRRLPSTGSGWNAGGIVSGTA